ncbi:hypothetical protein PV04_04371 [Phialophora macrospora]|uniref:Polycomb protein VEFS-Box domain-containing protein n=1 Tax=Phialophora macrospora TaxID=1851006 RepID=A0A0D2G950_9EURO|nr:hypothetical protein PV04_04371 [Phialophora macrospora]
MENGTQNHPSTSQRHRLFTQDLVGHFTWELERPKSRQHLFLQRNVLRVLEHHKERLRDPSSRASRPLSAANPHNTGEASARTTPRVSGLTGVVNSDTTKDQPPPRSRDTKPETNIRRSHRFRKIVERAHQQAGAELMLDLSSIRKKLTFKKNLRNDDERPAKRQKRDKVRCLCHLTIWDNRDGSAAVPLTSKTSDCLVTGVENGDHGHLVDIELDKPFIVSAEEIRVPVTRSNTTALEIIDKYFLEFKIIPCKTGSLWPPVPILGKSDGDNFSQNIKQSGSGGLQGAIVTQYTHLPTPPDMNVPLSVLFLHQGKTYRTKYGLQVRSVWQKAGAGRVAQESRGLDLNSFLSDQPNGIHTRGKARQQGHEPLMTFLEGIFPPSPVPQNQPEVCYSFPGGMVKRADVAEEFRTATAKGYGCPICTGRSFRELEKLRFHLTTMHTKYNFSVKPGTDRATNGPSPVHIKVDQPRRPTVRKEEDDGEMLWVAPTSPFDLQAFLSGDHSWIGGRGPIKLQPSSRPTTGYPLAKNVPDFRRARRRKIKPIVLEARGNNKPQCMYTSVSNRPVSPNEGPRSESDDEIDNEWLIAMQMECLDLIAEKGNWSPYERELAKRWDRHRMEEQLEHPTFVSNSLIRFARKHKEWLRNSGGDELLSCFFEFLVNLNERQVIDDDVVADVNELIFMDESRACPTASAGSTPLANSGLGTSMAPPAMAVPQEEAQNPLPELVCPLCNKLVKFKPKRNPITFCQDPACATASQRYHSRCILYSSTSQKGKGKAAAPNPEDEAIRFRLKFWLCKACTVRRKERTTAEADAHASGGIVGTVS